MDASDTWLVLVGGLIWSILASTTLAQSADSLHRTSADVQVLTAEDLAQAGVIRLSDVFTLLDDWSAYSLDGYTWHAAANGLASMQTPRWMLVVDGQPIDVSVLGVHNINMLPLRVAEIDRIEAIGTPVMEGGRFAQAGVLHLHTRIPERGPHLRGHVAAGNEVGDPGPFRYTGRATPNLDRIGPHAGGALSYGGAAWYVRLSGAVDEHHATDPQILPRIHALYNDRPRLKATGANLTLGSRSWLGHHVLHAGTNRLHDFRFFEPIGLEIPTKHILTHVGLTSDFTPDRPSGVRYRLGYTISDLDPRPNRRGVFFDWRQDRLQANAEFSLGDDILLGTFGVSFDQYRSVTGRPLADSLLTSSRAYYTLDFLPHLLWRQRFSVVLARTEDDYHLGGLGVSTVRPTPTHTFTLTLSYDRHPFAATNSLWYWTRQGLDFNTLTFHKIEDTRIRQPSSFTTSTTFTADLSWDWQPSDRWGVTLSGGYRRFDDATLAWYRMGYREQTDSFDPLTTVKTGAFGRVMRGTAEVRLRVIPFLEQRIHYAYMRYPTRDAAFWKAWRNQPWHRATYTARLTVHPRFSLFARVRYQSSTTWPDYGPAERESDRRYVARFSDRWLLDVTAEKRLWKDHLRARLSLRNALNDPVRYHPGGAITSMAFFVQVRAYF